VSVGSFWIFLLSLAVSSATFAHEAEEGKIYGTFGPFFYHTQSIYAPDGPYTPFPPVGGGLLAEGDINSTGGFELGLFYYRKSYDRAFGNALVVSKRDKLEIPMGYRYWINPSFSAAVEFSTSFSIGDPEIVYSNVVSGDQNTLANTLSEYDVDLSVQWEAWTYDRFSVVIDGRYAYALNANLGEDANEFGILFGLKYLIQEKDVTPRNDVDRDFKPEMD
jgi:hypothetical protein